MQAVVPPDAGTSSPATVPTTPSAPTPSPSTPEVTNSKPVPETTPAPNTETPAASAPAVAPPAPASEVSPAPGPVANPSAGKPADPISLVNSLKLTYDQPVKDGPALDELLKVDVVLALGSDGYYSHLLTRPDGTTAARHGMTTVRVRLADIASLSDHRFHASAIQSIAQQLTSDLEHRGLAGVYVLSDIKNSPASSPATLPAIAPQGQTLNLVIHNGAAEHDGASYKISEFILQYSRDIPGVPALSSISQRPVNLGKLANGDQLSYVGVETLNARGSSVKRTDLAGVVQSKISDAGILPGQIFRNSAILTIEEEIVRYINDQGIGGVYVDAERKDLDAAAAAAKGAESPAVPLHMTIHIATANMVRTIETGPHTHAGNKTDNPKDIYVKTGSPIQADGPKRLLKTNDLDEYVLRLNRQQGRHVDVAVAAGDEADSVSLDYLITETNPWIAFFQLSNTGTAQTNEWRERFGFVDHQLTGHDDNFYLDFTTAGFDESTALIGSYDFPIPGMETLRARVYSDYSSFTASDVGEGAQQFKGDSFEMGGEFINNIFQHRSLFVDAIGGAKYQHLRVDNSTTGDKGSGDYGLPYIGLRIDDNTETSAILGNIYLNGDFTGTSETSQDHLGRLDASRNFLYVSGDWNSSFFLEPLLNPSGYKRGQSTLAHEIVVSARGQYAFNHRFVAEQEEVAGGLYTVRGYPESIVAGDSVIVATGEYRFHLPRAFPVQRDPGRVLGQPFRYAPQQPYGRPDWDLIFRGFLDVGQTVNSQIEPFEENATLFGTGVGMELVIKHNISLRADWGVALNSISAKAGGGTAVEAGSNRFHLLFTFSY